MSIKSTIEKNRNVNFFSSLHQKAKAKKLSRINKQNTTREFDNIAIT